MMMTLRCVLTLRYRVFYDSVDTLVRIVSRDLSDGRVQLCILPHINRVTQPTEHWAPIVSIQQTYIHSGVSTQWRFTYI